MNQDNSIEKNNPLVSVVMPVYNAGKYLCGALDSILQQTYKNLELLCIDDGSTDDSFLILNQYRQHDKRVKCLKNTQNRGIGYTANLLASLARGRYIARMDADDISFLDRLEKQVNFLENNPDVVAVGGQCVTIDEYGKHTGYKVFPLENDEMYKMIFTAIPIQQPTMMINRTRLPKGYIWYDNRFSPVDDLDLFFRLFSFGKLANLADLVIKYREYRNSATLSNAKRSFYLTYKIRKRALNDYGYTPRLGAKIINLLQYFGVTLLPHRLLFPTYRIFRRILTINLLGRVSPEMKKSFERVSAQKAKDRLEVKTAYEFKLK